METQRLAGLQPIACPAEYMEEAVGEHCAAQAWQRGQAFTFKACYINVDFGVCRKLVGTPTGEVYFAVFYADQWLDIPPLTRCPKPRLKTINEKYTALVCPALPRLQNEEFFVWWED